jgi:hypothetical protein
VVAAGDDQRECVLRATIVKAIRLAGLLIAMVALGGCQGATATGTPSLTDSTAFLNHLVGLAQAHDFNGLCAVGDLNCSSELDTAGRDAVPPAAPRVIESHYIASSPGSNGMQSIGGLVFSVCGIDGRDQPYRSQVLVFPSGSSLAAINSVYWDNVSIADSATPSTPASPPSQPAGC